MDNFHENMSIIDETAEFLMANIDKTAEFLNNVIQKQTELCIKEEFSECICCGFNDKERELDENGVEKCCKYNCIEGRKLWLSQEYDENRPFGIEEENE